MKNSIKAFVNQVKKAITTKGSCKAAECAYVNNNGDLLAHEIGENQDILIFVASVVEDLNKCNKLYNKDALTLAANTGIFNGGEDVGPFEDYYKVPEEDFKTYGAIASEDLEAAAISTSKEAYRPALTAVHLSKEGYIESCDGFRAYRKFDSVGYNSEALKPSESGVFIPGRVAAYGLKGIIKVFASDKYIKLVDGCGVTLYIHKLTSNVYVNLNGVYPEKIGADSKGIAKIKNVKEFSEVLKVAAAAYKKDKSAGGIILRACNDSIEYYIKALNIYGSIEADIIEATAGGYFIEVNPKYILEALKQGGRVIYFGEKAKPSIIEADNGGAALVLPIRSDCCNPFDNMPKQEAKQEAAPEAVNPEEVPEAFTAPEEAKPEEAKQEAPAPVAPVEVKQEAPEDPEVMEARAAYNELVRSNYKPNKYQEAQAEAIYKNNKAVIAPIAKKVKGYIDLLAIIAVIMAIPEKLA